MKFGLYSIKDAKTGFMTPVLEQGDPAALRNFSAAVNSPDSLMYQYPNDFALYKVANFDTDTGIVPVLSPIQIADASEVLRNER